MKAALEMWVFFFLQSLIMCVGEAGVRAIGTPCWCLLKAMLSITWEDGWCILLCFNSQCSALAHHALLMKCVLFVRAAAHLVWIFKIASAKTNVAGKPSLNQYTYAKSSIRSRSLQPSEWSAPASTNCSQPNRALRAKLSSVVFNDAHFHPWLVLLQLSRPAAVCPEMYSCPLSWDMP